jgi:hypothetical protein
MGDVPRQDDDRDTSLTVRVLHRDPKPSWHLRRLANQLAIVAARRNKSLRMGLPNKTDPDLSGHYGRCQCQDWRSVLVGIVHVQRIGGPAGLLAPGPAARHNQGRL